MSALPSRVSLLCLILSGCAMSGQSQLSGEVLEAHALEKEASKTGAGDAWVKTAHAWLAVPDTERVEASVLHALKKNVDEQRLKPLVLQAAELSGLRAPPDVMWSFRHKSDFSIASFWSIRGRHLFTQKQYKSAVSDFTRVLAITPLRSSDWAFLARAHAESQDHEKAAEAGLQAVSLVIKSGSLTQRKRWAMLQFVVHQSRRAKRPDIVAEAGLIWLKQPGTPDLLSFLRSVEWPKEVRMIMLKRSLSDNPKNNDVRLSVGQHLFGAKKYTEAAEVLRATPRKTPVWGRAYEIGAEAAHRSGRHGLAIWMHAQLKDDARWALRATTRYGRNVNRTNRYRVINALMRAQRYAWARSEAYIDLFLRPRDTKLLYLHALAASLSVGERFGFTEMLKVLEVDPDHAAALNFVGYSLVVWNEDLKRAEELLTRALNAEPSNPSIMDSIAWLYYRKGQLDAALPLLRSALSKLPGSGTVTFHLACVLRKLGKIEESETLYRHALELETDPQERARFEPEWSAIQ